MIIVHSSANVESCYVKYSTVQSGGLADTIFGSLQTYNFKITVSLLYNFLKIFS